MQIRLDQISEEPFTWHGSETIPIAELDRAELVALSPIEWRGSVSCLESGFHFRARLDYRQTLTCDRCLVPIEQPVGVDLELLVVVEPTPEDDAERQLDDEDLGVLKIPGETLETRGLLYEQIQINLPMKPLCRPDCKGLCPRCGADLNLGPCACGEAETDPRWTGLAALRDRLASDSEDPNES